MSESRSIGWAVDGMTDDELGSPHFLLSYNPGEMPMPTRRASTSSSSSSSSSSDDEPAPAAPPQTNRQMNSPVQRYCWQIISPGNPFPVDCAVRAGVDADGAPIYAGRAFHEGNLLPAKVIPSHNVAYVGHDGGEHAKDVYEVLRNGSFVWEFATNGAVPDGAVEFGVSSEGEKLYLGRAMHAGTQTPGKIHPSHGCLYIPFDGAEVPLSEYEVLVTK